MKEAKDAIDGALLGNRGDSHLLSEKNTQRRKRAKPSGEVSSDGSDASGDDSYLEPTPLAVHDAAYVDKAEDGIDDLGFRIGRMRLGERIGGLYRPRIADEVRGWPLLEAFPNTAYRFCLPFNTARRAPPHQYYHKRLLLRLMAPYSLDHPSRLPQLT